MVKLLSTVILLSLLIPINLNLAQAGTESSKTYSGYLHLYDLKTKQPFWRVLFSPTFPKHEQLVENWQCKLEFRGPVKFVHQPVTELPKSLSYTIKFNNDGLLPDESSINAKDAFKKFIIEIYVPDGQMYTIDPQEEGLQVGINDVHHLYDQHLIYLILGQDIEHIEVVDLSGYHDKYVLDNFEIHNDH